MWNGERESDLKPVGVHLWSKSNPSALSLVEGETIGERVLEREGGIVFYETDSSFSSTSLGLYRLTAFWPKFIRKVFY